MGLGAALNFGLNQCMHDLVIRADSDDINRTNRFECILDFMTKNGDVHILSSWVEEFEFNPGDKGIIKKYQVGILYLNIQKTDLLLITLQLHLKSVK